MARGIDYAIFAILTVFLVWLFYLTAWKGNQPVPVVVPSPHVPALTEPVESPDTLRVYASPTTMATPTDNAVTHPSVLPVSSASGIPSSSTSP